tara:strand:- start:54 stop:296 length:243 start_codon:yes stop_codon:yes gene_type:complete
MPQIGWFEILIIVSVAIIIVGPKDFPIMIRKVGSWVGSIKKYINNVQNQVTDITKIDAEDDQGKKEFSDINKDKDTNDRT